MELSLTQQFQTSPNSGEQPLKIAFLYNLRFPNNSLPAGITYFNQMPPIEIFRLFCAKQQKTCGKMTLSEDLILTLKKQRINTIFLTLLLKDLSEPIILIEALKLLPQQLTTQFYTLSYLKKTLNKIIVNAKLQLPGAFLLRNPMLMSKVYGLSAG